MPGGGGVDTLIWMGHVLAIWQYSFFSRGEYWRRGGWDEALSRLHPLAGLCPHWGRLAVHCSEDSLPPSLMAGPCSSLRAGLGAMRAAALVPAVARPGCFLCGSHQLHRLVPCCSFLGQGQ